MAELFANDFSTTLASGCTAGALTITTAAAAPATLQGGTFRIAINSELLLVTAGQGTTTWTVTRGIEGTTAAAHVGGSSVTHVLTSAGLATAVEVLVGAAPGGELAGTWASPTVDAVHAGSAHHAEDTATPAEVAAARASFSSVGAHLTAADTATTHLWMAGARAAGPRVMDSPPTVTLGAAGAASAIVSSVLTSSRSGATVAPPFRYTGASIVQLGAGWPDLQYVGIVTGTVPVPFRVQFTTNADAFELFTKGTAGKFRVRVNGELASVAPFSAGAADGDSHLNLVTFATAASREITVEMFGAFGGIRVGPTYTVTAPTSAAPTTRLLVMGDSYTDGTGADAAFTAFPYVLGDCLGIGDIWASGRGGTGYLEPGAFSTFRSRLAADVVALSPDIVIVAGGLNDPTVGLQAEAALLFAAIQAGLPSAQLIVISPFWPRLPVHADITAKTASLRAAAATAGVQFIDMITAPWITGTGRVGTPNGDGNADLFTSADGTHPSQAGHNYYGYRLSGQIVQP